MANDPIKIGMIGFGNVGRGVFEILQKNNGAITKRVAHEIQVKTIVVRDISKHQDINIGSAILSSDINDILNDSEIQVVVEVIGGEQPAFDYISAALKAKKYVVTANKEVVSKHK